MKNRYIILLIVSCLNCNLFSQSFDCYTSDSILSKDIIVAYKDFVTSFNVSNSIVLIDYIKNGSFSTLKMINSKEFYEIFYKRPNCYFKSDTNIAYLFTKHYTDEKDTLWLNQVFIETLKVFPKLNEIKVNWKNNSILSFKRDVKATVYDPPVVEYEIENGIILKRSFSNKMFFPDSHHLPKYNFYRWYDGVFKP